ncbi:MAG: hypothetical protein RL635_243 [Chloroflexota bacterium]|jgi:gas vesicle protein
MSNNSSDSGAFVVGFIVGGLVGAAVALLLAPQTGEETRSDLMRKGIELRERGESALHEARVRAEELAAEASEWAKHTAEDVAKGARSKMRGKAADGEA